MADKEKELLIHALTIIKYCKEHKNCKGCMFWNNTTCCPFNVSCPSKWRIYGFKNKLLAELSKRGRDDLLSRLKDEAERRGME